MSIEDVEKLFGQMLDGEMSDDAISNLLVEMADRGETPDEVVGAVRAMRQRMIGLDRLSDAIDVCGTGGDGQHTLNVSTATAIVVAACGVEVAKHGNRAASSKAGAADTLEALGLNLDLASKRAEKTLRELNIAFFFAQAHHPALGRIAPIRKALGRRTIFNLLGPLANPARVSRQLVGVPSPQLVPLYQDAMTKLGMTRAMIVSGNEGLDELSISGPRTISTVGFDGFGDTVSPGDAGLEASPLEYLRGGDAEFNAAALNRLLDGEEGAYRNAVLLNSAGGLIVADGAESWTEGARLAALAIDSGKARVVLDRWIEMTRE